MVDTTRRRITTTNLAKNWNGVSAVSTSVVANEGISQHQLVVYAAGTPAVGLVKIEAKAIGSNFWVPIGTIDLTRNGTGTMIFCALLDGIRLSFPGGISGGMSIGADIYSTGLFFTVGDDYLQNTERRRVPRTQIATGWNGVGSVTMSTPEHGPLTQHQLAIAGGTGLVELKGRPTGGTQFVTIDVQCEQIDTSGMLVIFAGMYDAFQLVPQGTVTGSINAQICSVGELLFFNNVAQGVYGDATHVPVITVNGGGQITSITTVPINVVAALGYTPANDANVVHLAGAETITGAKTFNASFTLGAGAQINVLNNATVIQSVGNGFIKTGANGGFFAISQGSGNPFAVADSSGNSRCFWDTNGAQSLALTYGYMGGTGGATGSIAAWTATANAYFISQNAEWSSGAWKSQNNVGKPVWVGWAANGNLDGYATTVPASAGVAVTPNRTWSVSPGGEIISYALGGGDNSGFGQFRMLNGPAATVGVFWRFDGGSLYLLKTASGSPLGTWDATRPFTFNISGGITSDQTWNWNNTAYNNYHGFTNTGSNGAGFWLNGQGSTTPNKLIRAFNGILQFVNSANSVVLMSLNDFTTAASLILTGGFYPASDNAYPIGSGTQRWTTIFATTGTINTSDQRDKNVLGPITLGLDFVNSVTPKQFKFLVKHNDVTPLLDANGEPILDANGEFQKVITPIPGVRTHLGTMAQDVYAALQAAGIDPNTMGMWTLDDPNDPNSKQGLRENELMWILWTAVQQLSAKVVSTQSDITAIKAKLGMP